MKAKSTPTAKGPSRDRRRRAAIIALIAVLVVATALVARYAASRAPAAPKKTSQAATEPAAPTSAPTPAPRVQRSKAVAEPPKQAAVVKTVSARADGAASPAPTAAS